MSPSPLGGSKKGSAIGATSSGYYAKLQQRATAANNNSNNINNSSSRGHDNNKSVTNNRVKNTAQQQQPADIDSSDRQVAMAARRAANKLYVVAADKTGEHFDAADTDSQQLIMQDKASSSHNDSTADDRQLAMMSHQVAHILRSNRTRPDHITESQQPIIQDNAGSSHNDSTADDREWAMMSHQVAHILQKSNSDRQRPDIGKSTSADLFRLLDRSGDIASTSNDQNHDSSSLQDRSWVREQRLEYNKIQSANRKHMLLETTITPSTHTPSFSSSSSSSSPLPPMDQWGSPDGQDDIVQNLSIEDTQVIMKVRHEANNIRRSSRNNKISSTGIATVSHTSYNSRVPKNHYMGGEGGDSESNADRNLVMETRQHAHSIQPNLERKGRKQAVILDGKRGTIETIDYASNTDTPRTSHNNSRENQQLDTTLATDQFLAHLIESSMPEKSPSYQDRYIIHPGDKRSKETTHLPMKTQGAQPKALNITTLTSDQLFLHLDASPPSNDHIEHQSNPATSTLHNSINSLRATNHTSHTETRRNNIDSINTSANLQSLHESSMLQRMIPSFSPVQNPLKSNPSMPNSIRSIVAAFSCVDESHDVLPEDDPLVMVDPLIKAQEEKRVMRQALISTATTAAKTVSQDIFTMCEPLCNTETPKDIPRSKDWDLTREPLIKTPSQRYIADDETSIFTFITKSSEAPANSTRSSALDLSFPGEKTVTRSRSTLSDKRWSSNGSVISTTSSTKLAKKMNRVNLLDKTNEEPSSQAIHSGSKRLSVDPAMNKQSAVDWELEWIKSQLQIKHMIATNIVDWFRSESEMAIMAKNVDEMMHKQEEYTDEIQRLMVASQDGDPSDTLSGSQSDNVLRKEELQRENFKLKARIQKMKEEASIPKEPRKNIDLEISAPDHISESLTLRAELVELRSQITDLKVKNLELKGDLEKEKASHEKMQRQFENDRKLDEKTQALQKEIHSLQFVAKIKSESLVDCKNQITLLEQQLKDLILQSKVDSETYQKEIADLKILLDQFSQETGVTETDEDESFKEKIALLEQELAFEREKSDQKTNIKIGGRVEAKVLAYKKKYEQILVKYEQCLSNEKALNEKISELESEAILNKTREDCEGMIVIHENLSGLATEKVNNRNNFSSFSDDDDADEKTTIIQGLQQQIDSLQMELADVKKQSKLNSKKEMIQDIPDSFGLSNVQTSCTDKYLILEESETSLKQSPDQALRQYESMKTIEKNLKEIISSLEVEIDLQRQEITDSKRRAEELTKALDETDELLKEASCTAQEKQRLEKELSKLSTELIESRAKARRATVKAEVDLSALREVEIQLRQEIVALHEQIDKLSNEKEQQGRFALSDDGIAEQLRSRDEKLHDYERSIEKLNDKIAQLEAKHKEEWNDYTKRINEELNTLRQSKSDSLQTLQTIQSYADQIKSDYNRLLLKSDTDLRHFMISEELLRHQLLQAKEKYLSIVRQPSVYNMTKVQDDVAVVDEFEIEMIDPVDENDDLDGIDPIATSQSLMEQNLRASLLDAQSQIDNWKSLYERCIHDIVSAQSKDSLVTELDKTPVSDISNIRLENKENSNIWGAAMYETPTTSKQHDYGPTQFTEELKDSLGLVSLIEEESQL